MNLSKKKQLASRVLGVGKGRIVFENARLEEIKEAITSQDMRELFKSRAIRIKSPSGRKSKARGRKSGPGKIKKKIKNRKRKYVLLTRKLRGYSKRLLEQEKIKKEDYKKIRNDIRGSKYKSKAHLRELLKEAKILK